MMHFSQTLRARLLGPLIALLVAFIAVSCLVAWTFRAKYAQLSQHIALSADMRRHTFALYDNRARTLELLLLFRLNPEPAYADELSSLRRARLDDLDHMQAYA